MMADHRSSLAEAARRMSAALIAETTLARIGTLRDLADAAEAKQREFAKFREACNAHPSGSLPSETDRSELRALLAAASESALVLDAVQATLRRFLDGLREAAGTLADAGTYAPSGRRPRHVLAVQLDASV